MFPWALLTVIRPPDQKSFAKNPGNVWSKSEKQGKQIFRKKSFFFQNDPQRSYKAVLTNATNCFARSPKWIK